MRNLKYILFSMLSFTVLAFYLWGAVIKKGFWFYAVPLLVLTTLFFTSLMYIGINMVIKKTQVFSKRAAAFASAFCFSFALLNIYYGVFIEPVYRLRALAGSAVVIFGPFLLGLAWIESIAARQLHIHQENYDLAAREKSMNEAPSRVRDGFSERNTERPSFIRSLKAAVLWPRMYKSQILSVALSVFCLSFAVILILGAIKLKSWVISVPVSIFTTILLASYFIYCLMAVKVGKKEVKNVLL